MIVLSNNFVLTEDTLGLTNDHPIVGWHSLLTVSNVVADTEENDFPATNLANPATHLRWQATDTTLQYITIATNTADEIDYVAIARHNLGSEAIAVTIGYFDNNSPAVWHDLVQETLLPNDAPAIFRFTPQAIDVIKVRLSIGLGDPARIAVMYVGKLLVLPRKIYQGLTPTPFGRISKATNGQSEAGNYLGRIVTQEFIQGKIPLSLIDPAYYRTYIDGFIAVSKDTPFFFAWRPEIYPMESGYFIMTNDPMPVNESPHGLMAMTFEMSGVT